MILATWSLVLMGIGQSSVPSSPAFLDSPTKVRVWLDKPLLSSELSSKQFRVTLAGKEVKIKSVEPGGEAGPERLLPRTPGRVILAGTLQSGLGASEWDPDGEVTQMDEVKPGVHELVVKVPKGNYEYKVTRDGSWAENYGANFMAGGSNIPLNVAEPTIIKFVVDFNEKKILNSLEHPDLVSAPSVVPPRKAGNGSLKFPVAVVELARPINADDISKPLKLTYEGLTRTVYSRDVLNQPEYVYQGDDLGSRWNPTHTTFKVWSPVSTKVTLLLGSSRIPMKKGSEGVWEAKVNGDLNESLYRYELTSYGEVRVAQDINCYSASPDASHSMVVNLAKTNPAKWPSVSLLKPKSQTDAILYEISVRDFTSLPSSGVPEELRGKYKGLVFPGAKVPGTSTPTGIDYLKHLGVTDIHLLPVQKFLNRPDEYTWGYATNLFNVPEESYSANPNNAVEVIREFKEMVSGVHSAGMRVVLDVVYNHTWPPEGKDSAFWQTVPYYYFRTNDQGTILNESGVGNALNDERPMARKFVRDSLLYWLKEYKVDGFRFDLLGMHHPDSVKDWVQSVRKVRPDATLYGEPWTGGGPTRFAKGAQRSMGIAVFNDRFRNLFRGDLDGPNPGFIMGAPATRNELKLAMMGSIDLGELKGIVDFPHESVNYISAHDNLTLVDKVTRSMPDNPELHASAVRFAHAVTLLSQGVPFIEGGSELFRTKGGNHNSYDAGDKVNGFDWSRGTAYGEVSEYLKGLIEFRKANSAFRMDSPTEIQKAVTFFDYTFPFICSYELKSSSSAYSQYLVVIHGGTKPVTHYLPAGDWKLLVSGEKAGSQPQGTDSGEVTLLPLSANVWAR